MHSFESADIGVLVGITCFKVFAPITSDGCKEVTSIRCVVLEFPRLYIKRTVKSVYFLRAFIEVVVILSDKYRLCIFGLLVEDNDGITVNGGTASFVSKLRRCLLGVEGFYKVCILRIVCRCSFRIVCFYTENFTWNLSYIMLMCICCFAFVVLSHIPL